MEGMDDKLKHALRDMRRAYEALYGDRLVTVLLFGSQARGDADVESDIDVLVVLRGDVDAYSEIQRTSQLDLELCLKHNVVICPVYVSEEEFTNKKGPLLRNVRREGVPV